MNTAAIGASLASAEIHNSSELKERQDKLQANVKLFDSLIETEQRGTAFPIKLVSTSHEHAITAGLNLYHNGFYVSPVFFPIVAKDKAGLRVMLRAGLDEQEVKSLCDVILNSQLR